MEEIFLFLVGLEYFRNIWRNLYILSLLDFLVWNGTCVLRSIKTVKKPQ